MSKLTPFDIEFFEISTTLATELNEDSKKTLVKTLLKLNNPTYFYKYVKRHPIELHGLNAHKTTNPVLVAISSMINILKTENNLELLQKKLQTEFAWAFNNYPKYNSVNL